jgi:hypothetical protein
MKNLFFMGGTLFMSILTMLLVLMIAWFIYHLVVVFYSKGLSFEIVLRRMAYGKSIGLFAMITGIFGQLIGLYEAFTAIEKAGDISPALVYAGIKVSMITTLYGITIYLISILIWGLASILIERLPEKQQK